MKVLERIFCYRNKQIRTVQVEGEPWFVAADVCAVLGLTQVTRAISRLDEDEGGLLKVTHPQNPAKSILVNAVNEPGLYRLILACQKTEAALFRRWITHEVIPELRRSGSYQLPQLSAHALLKLVMETGNECEVLRQENAELRPKAEYYDRVADTRDSFSLGETAKMLEVQGFGRNKLIRFLRSEGVLMSGNVAKQRYVERGYFHVVQAGYFAPDGTQRVKAVTRVYVKGVNFIRHRLDAFFLQYV